MTVLLLIATVLLFLAIDWAIQRSRLRAVAGPASARPPGAPRALTVRLPDGIFFAPSHTWLNLFPSGKVRVGVDDFVTGLVEHPAIELLKKAGEPVHRGDPIIRLRSGDHSLTLRAPVDGEVIQTNDQLPRNPRILETGLFDSGWAYVLRPSRITDLKEFLLGSESRAWMAQEMRRLKDLLTGSDGVRPAFMQEGGPPVAGALGGAAEDRIWKRFDREFLDVSGAAAPSFQG